MSDKLFDVDCVEGITGRRIIFDTNIWMYVEGFSTNRYATDKYSNLLKKIKQSDNKIVINDYILSEFFNRCLKNQYEEDRMSYENPENFISFKLYRQDSQYRDNIETIRDTCLNILEDCEYVGMSSECYKIGDVIETACIGKMDFSDIMIVEQCKSYGFMLASHDADYLGAGVELLTANPKALKAGRCASRAPSMFDR